MHGGFTRRGPDWRKWIVMLAVALIGATSVSSIWHGPHDADQDCAVCSLRHHAVADLVGALPTGPADTPELGVPAPTQRWIAADHGSQLPARAPPA